MKTKNPRITINAARYEIFVGKREVHLTRTEFDLVSVLKNCNVTLDREDLIRAVWGVGRQAIDERTVDQHVARIRRKVGVPIIATVPWRGYKYAGA